MAEKTAYLDRGPGAIERYLQREKQRSDRRARGGSSRFKLDPGETKLITLINVVGIFFGEHSGKQGNYFWKKICSADINKNQGPEKPVCTYCNEGTKLRDMMLVGTCINHTGFEDDEGKLIKNFKQIWCVYFTGLASWLAEVKKLPEEKWYKNPYAWTLWEVRRGPQERSVACGEYFNLKYDFKSKQGFVNAMTKKGMEKEDWDAFLSPADYAEILKTDTEAEARAFLGLGPVPGSAEDVPPEAVDDVPFDMEPEEGESTEKSIDDVLDEI